MRGDGAPLMLPLLTRTEEQSAAKERAQDADRGCGPDVITGVFDQNSANGIRSIENELTMAAESVDDHVVFERLAWKRCQCVAAQGPHRRSP